MSLADDIGDRGLLLGDGLFETLLVDRGAPINLAAHLDRLARGCAVIGLPAPPIDQVKAAIAAAVAGQGLDHSRAAVRVTWSAGPGGRGLDRPSPLRPRLSCAAAPAPTSASPASVVTVSVRRNEGSPLSRLKSLSYLDNVLARREAQAAGADEALMLNNRGEIACAGAANLFWIEGGVLFTPALDCGVLDGTVRARVLERARGLGIEAREVRVGLERLDAAEGLFLTNSLIGLRPVRRLAARDLSAHRMIAHLSAVVSDSP